MVGRVLVWQRHDRPGAVRPCGACGRRIISGEDYAVVTFDHEARTVQRGLVRCQACGLQFEADRTAAREARGEREPGSEG
jgi:hypothetical protein